MKKVIIDVATGNRIERDLTAEEIAEREAFEAEIESANTELAAQEEAKADAKASAIAKLEALGLTLDEVKVAFGLEADSGD